MQEQLGTRYNPASIEERIYATWQQSGLFAPGQTAAKTFTIMIPPPNVTGALHMGHGLNNTLQDTVIRFWRMRGRRALWMPGTDHAGIATQNVVEKELKKQGKSRHDFGRERFVAEIWAWKDHYEKRILDQLKRLGASCDWSRTRFTMDEGLSHAVRTAFVRWFDRGLIYRGHYIVNWCPRCQTALSDEESEHQEIKGHLWKLRYPIKNGAGAALEIATTRPETMLGDVAVAVNPNDIRYKKLVGKTLILPLVDREIPIVADDMVDSEFGTGAVKVTPAHDPNDFELGQRHKLTPICIMAPDGSMNENAPPAYQGMDRFKARKKIVEDLEAQNLLAGVMEHRHSVGHCYRCNTIVEPYLSDQWFVKTKPLAEKAIAAQKKGWIKFHPARWEKIYLSWLENIRDWCISRQIWWGHRIPVWTCKSCGLVKAYMKDPKQCAQCKGKDLEQDPDVLDTWFSSQLWPFSTLGWPAETEDLKAFYPTNLLSTDRGIIFFWVARMVMAGLDLVDKGDLARQIPFSDVYIHATVLDAQGRKMSKSLGNGIDPIAMVEEYGADAVRFSLMILTKEGQDIKLAPTKFLQGRNFCNKVWNAARFTLSNLRSAPKANAAKASKLEDRWIRSRLTQTIEKVTEFLEVYQLNDAAQCLYTFIWNDFCDWYLEAVKPRLSSDNDDAEQVRAVLCEVLDNSLRLLHPFTPYITEEIWGKLRAYLPETKTQLCMSAPWPTKEQAGRLDMQVEAEMNLLQDVVRALRNVRAINNLPAQDRPLPVISTESAELANQLKQYAAAIAHFAQTMEPKIGVKLARPTASGLDVFQGGSVYLPLGENIDVAAQRSILQKKIEKVGKGISAVEAKLANPGFLQNAEAQVIEAEKNRCAELRKEMALLEENLRGL